MKPKVRIKAVSLRVTEEMYRLLLVSASKLTTQTGRRHTMTDVIERGISEVAKKVGAK